MTGNCSALNDTAKIGISINESWQGKKSYSLNLGSVTKLWLSSAKGNYLDLLKKVKARRNSGDKPVRR
jgi:hypothetical protein